MSESLMQPPSDSFLAQNARPVRRIFETIREVFPDSGVELVLDDDLVNPSSEARDWMWAKLMGHQHGSQEGLGGKIPLTRELEYRFWPYITQLAYGSRSFAAPQPASLDRHYTKAFILGGSTQEFTNRIMAATHDQPLAGNIDTVIVMGGQRLRFDYPGERTTAEIYQTVHEYSGADMDRVRDHSPWVKTEERKTGEDWEQAFASEYEMGRLVVEALFFDAIDWSNYPVTPIPAEDEPLITITARGDTVITPPRQEAAVVYTLQNGSEVYVINGKAHPRTRGIPRPTSDSQTREAVELTDFTADESLVFAVDVPFVRAAMDSFIRVASLQLPTIKHAEVASGGWLPDIEALVALGEIPATHKADQRLRAVINGQNPDSSELISL